MDFKISEDFQDEENKESTIKKDNSKIRIIIAVVIAIIVFLVIFLFLNGLLNPKKKDTPKQPNVVESEKRPLTESNVKILYGYVTYSTNPNGPRYDKFVKNDKVTLKDFTDEEKYYYALQYVQVEDFIFTEKYDENKNPIFSISDRKIKKYMEYFFGKNVKYSTDITIKYPFSFSIDDKNVGTMKYDSETASFLTTFAKEEKVDETNIIDPYLGKLVEAYKEPDGGYRLVEKVIYVNIKQQNDGKYEVIISKDYDHKNLIESIKDQSEADLKKITVDKYIDKAATITYNFKLNGNTNILVFESSEIK